MPDTQKQSNPNPADNLGKMFESFGNALSKIFDDPVLKAKAKDFGQSAAASAKTFAGRFKDEEVKAGFRDVGKAAEQFGKSVADQFKGDKGAKS
jgi:ribosomal-protein-alanine N-acetyltransferase